MSIESFPLSWPQGWPRAKVRERARFKTTFEGARKELYRELGLMGVPDWNIILSTNLPLRRDGMPYSGAKPANGDPGVAIYFQKEDSEKRFVFACDRWDRIEDNMRAIQHSIAAIRGIERWGASDMLERAFTGFTALPEPEKSNAWWDALGVPRQADLEFIEHTYRQKMRGAHPDLGGSHEAARRLNAAIEQARLEKRGTQ